MKVMMSLCAVSLAFGLEAAPLNQKRKPKKNPKKLKIRFKEESKA